MNRRKNGLKILKKPRIRNGNSDCIETQLFSSWVTTYNRISIVDTMEYINEIAYILLANL